MKPFSTRLLVHSPHFIFARGARRLPDEVFIDRFGFVAEERHMRDELLTAKSTPSTLIEQGAMRPVFVIAEATGWKMIADDWLYNLWHNTSTQVVVEQLATEGDVFTFSVGDSDNAYDLRSFRDGQLVREWIVDDKFGGGDQRLLVDRGVPLEGEEGLRADGVLVDYLLAVARLNGFDLAEAISTARMWICRPNPQASRVDETERRTRSWRSG